MRYCARCLYPENHPLHLTFDGQGVCSGCRVHEEKDTLDWSARRDRLERLLSSYRNTTGANYDCIVPVSGGRDSCFIVHTVKNVFGLRPLLVHYNTQYNTELGIRNLAFLRMRFNCDLIGMTLSPELIKKVTRETMRLMASMYWHCIAGSTVFPVQAAVRFKIPLIVWGAHQGLDQVGMFSHLDEVEMTRKYRKEHDLMGFEAEDLAAASSVLSGRDVLPFAYPHDRELEKVGVRGIYLGNFLRWDSKAQHEAMIAAHGYEPGSQERTFDTYNHVDCHHYSGTHDWIKFLKYGYGKALDHACREIRLKRLTRAQGLELVLRHGGDREPRDLPLFLRWLGMERGEFLRLVDARRDPAVWRRGAHGAWELLDAPERHPEEAAHRAAALPVREGCSFRPGPERAPDAHIIYGRGYSDEPGARRLEPGP